MVGEYQTVVKVVGLSIVDLGVPAPVITTDFERFNSRRLGEFGNRILNGMRYMFGGHHVRDAQNLGNTLCSIHNLFRDTKG